MKGFHILSASVVCLIILAGLFPALASESPDAGRGNHDDTSAGGGGAPPVNTQAPRWTAFARTTALAAAGVDDYTGNLSMWEVDAGFTGKSNVNPRFELSWGLNYSLKDIHAPQAAQLPSSLHRLALNIGGLYKVSEALSVGFTASPGLSSDFNAVGSSDIRSPVGLYVRRQMSPRLALTGGVVYAIGNEELQVLPIVGATYKPSEVWTFSLGFPRTGITMKPDKGAEYYLGAEFSAGEYRLHDASIGARVISYRDYRAIAGAEWALHPSIKLGIAGGYSFGRKFVFQDSSRDDLTVNSAPFGRLELKFMW